MVDDGYPYWVSPDFCVSGRARRIVELIEKRGTLSVEEIAGMQMDQVAIPARVMMRGLDEIESNDPELVPVFHLFRNWDGNLAATGPQSAVYEVFTRLLILNITRPKLGELAPRYAGKGPTPVLYEGTIYGEHAREWLMTVLSDPQSPWWDSGGGRTRLISHTMRETVDTLKQTCGPRMEDWSSGRLHGLIFRHPLGSIKSLDRVFNRGPFPTGGDGDTIWASGVNRLDLGEREMVGPPFRLIADLSDWNNSQGILVPGQSGHPASQHYDDNITDFFAGKYHPMLFDREQVSKHTISTLTLNPH